MSEIKILNARLSFPEIWKPKAVNEGDTPRFSCSLLLTKEDQLDQIQMIKAAIWELAKTSKEFGGEEMAKKLLKTHKLHVPLHDGEEKDYEGYGPEIMFMSCSTTKRPSVVDRDLTTLVESDGRPYAGCYVNAVVRLWPQVHPKGGKRINCELRGLQFVKDGDAFGAPPFKPEEAFEALDPVPNKGPAASKGKAEVPELLPSDDDDIPF